MSVHMRAFERTAAVPGKCPGDVPRAWLGSGDSFGGVAGTSAHGICPVSMLGDVLLRSVFQDASIGTDVSSTLCLTP